MIPLGVRDRGRGSAISRNLPASSSSNDGVGRCYYRRARGLRFADSRRTGTVLDVITREITCGFERASLSHLHLHSPFFRRSRSTSIVPCVAISAIPFARSLTRSLDVRRTFNHFLPSPPLQQHRRDIGNPPRGVEGSQLLYPICPYFS